MVNPALDDGTGEVIFTAHDESRILVKVSALKDENRRPLYLLFTPRAMIKPSTDMMQGSSSTTTTMPVASTHNHTRGRGHHNHGHTHAMR